MSERLTDMIEDVTGRKVLTYQPQVLFEPCSPSRARAASSTARSRSSSPTPWRGHGTTSAP